MDPQESSRFIALIAGHNLHVFPFKPGAMQSH
jgi:hypothetical protein